MRAERYDNPQFIDRLAREYVLGTLNGAARRRFQRELVISLLARRSVADWEAKLTPLVGSITPLTPPAAVWPGIRRRLGFADLKADKRRPRSFAGLAAMLAILSLALSLLYITRPPVPVSADYVAVMTDDEAGPVWLLQAFTEAGEMRVSSLGLFPAPTDMAYELWMLPDDQSPPVSLGLLDGTADSTLVLTPERIATLRGSSVLAVSVEPAGGSPTGAPTGPVILTAPLLTS